MNVAQADAGIASWETKYVYDSVRPVTAIRRAGEDDNAGTTADATWTPLGPPGNGTTIPDFTPPFPAYVSGHATFGEATMKTLANFYGTDDMQFTLHSDELPGVTCDYDHLSQAGLVENAASRIYLGIHWQFDADFGIAMGNKVANWVFSHILQPRGGQQVIVGGEKRHAAGDGAGRGEQCRHLQLAADPERDPELVGLTGSGDELV